ncbi:MAG: hypothetical protein WCA46_05795 [Actinocatenispora sp.]
MSSTGTRLTLAARPWSHLVPLALREVETPGLDLRVTRRSVTPDLLAEPGLDAAETSFSRYVRSRAAGDDRTVAIPAFVMRAFRHRCILVRRDSPYDAVEQLAGLRIGLTGWPDSGNVWTRGVLRHAGVALADVEWAVGPLTPDAPVTDRLGGVVPADNVRVIEPGGSLVTGLLSGTLDAIMTPFMPPGFHQPDSPLRPLLVDYPAAEMQYLRQVGYIPGIHLVTVRREVAVRRPGILTDLMAALRQSRNTWWAGQRKLADTTPWALADIHRTERHVGADWMPYGLAGNATMIDHFCAELSAQGLMPAPVDPTALFEEYAKAAAEEGH